MVLVAVLVTGAALHAGDTVVVWPSPHRRLVDALLHALPWAVVAWVTVGTAWMLEDLAHLGEQGLAALHSVVHALKVGR